MSETHSLKWLPLSICAFTMLFASRLAFAWGDEGHEIVGRIASHYLTPAVRAKVNKLLKSDSTHLTPATDIATEATWADKYRDSDRDSTEVRYNQTRNWHYVDIELDAADIDSACFGHPALPANTPASQGPAEDCIVDKIDEFLVELKNSKTSADERREALQFVLHFVGDLHQPLHSSDDHDKGGNDKHVASQGIEANNLHHYWDTEFVAKLGTDSKKVSKQLIANITAANLAQWREGTATDWAREAFLISKKKAYGLLPKPNADASYTLSAAYVKSATKTAGTQLSKAGVRLAMVLNEALQ